MIIAKSMADISRYYNKKTNTYDFKDEMGRYVAVRIDFDLYTKANIISGDIKCKNIIAGDISSMNIKCRNIYSENLRGYNITASNMSTRDLWANNVKAVDVSAHNIIVSDISAFDIKSLVDINANHIEFYAVCMAYHDIVCETIRGLRKNSRYFVLDGKVTIKKRGIIFD